MAYTKQGFTDNRKLMAAQLEKMEEGIIDASVDVAQSSGASTTAVMSQKATTDYVVQKLATLAQVEPEFAQTVEECTDTTKLYVLPDGYIYAYMYVEEEIAPYTNLFDTYADGYLEGYRINSSGEETETSGSIVTNYIPFTLGESTIRIKGLQDNVLGYTNYIRIAFYDSDKSGVGLTQPYASYAETWLASADDGSVIEWPVLYKDGEYSANYPGAVYMRLSGFLTGDVSDIIVTIDEAISGNGESVKVYKWANTGRAFVPADYEDRIIAVEALAARNKTGIDAIDANIAAIDGRVSSLENGIATSAPDYWVAAVDALSDTVRDNQHAGGADSFQFLWMADLHGANGYTNTNGAGTSVTAHVGNVAQYALERYDIPAFVISGDIMSQAAHGSESGVWTEYEAIREILAPVDDARLVYTKGNHDGAWGGAVDGVYYLNNIGGDKVYDAIFRPQATGDRNRAFGRGGSYFYIDYPQRVRLFVLNCQTDGDGSADASGHAVYNSMKTSVYGSDQLAWFAANLADTPDGWTVVVTAHQPLNQSSDGSLLAGLIEAYNSRKTYSNSVDVSGDYWGSGVSDDTYTTSKVDADFSGGVGEVAAFFHGHIHFDRIDDSTYSFPCISITTAGADVRDTDPPLRTAGTATETAMDIVTINTADRTIRMTRLGAGEDRETNY